MGCAWVGSWASPYTSWGSDSCGRPVYVGQVDAGVGVNAPIPAELHGGISDTATAQFTHDAQSVLAERLGQVSDAGAGRVDRKLSEILNGIEQRRDEFLADFQRRISDTEAELRSQVRAIGADAEAERAVLEARVHELTRRLESAVAQAETSLASAFHAE